MVKVAEGAVKAPLANVNAPFIVNELADEASTVPLYPELIAKLVTVGAVLTVQFFVLVPSKTTASLDVGAVSVDQFAASVQLFVEPPPSHVLVAQKPCGARTNSATNKAASLNNRAAFIGALSQVNTRSPACLLEQAG
jgi:hypothetical protein